MLTANFAAVHWMTLKFQFKTSNGTAIELVSPTIVAGEIVN